MKTFYVSLILSILLLVVYWQSARRPVRATALCIALIFKAFALTGRQITAPNNPGRCPGLRASALSGRAASMRFCPLPFPSAGDRWFMACCFYALLGLQFIL